MDEEVNLELSPLCQEISSGGKTVQVDIYKDENGKWILELQDEHGNSTVWEDRFETDMSALTEVKKAILEEGISTFIGP